MAGDAIGLDAGDAVLSALRAISERLDELEPAALADEPDAVHQLRTHLRRLRSVLAAYAPLFDASVVQALRRRYRVMGAELGVVRDLEVRVQVAEAALHEASEDGAADPAGLDLLRPRLVDDEIEAHRLAHTRFVELQRMPRAAERRAALAGFLADAPVMPPAAEPAGPVLAGLLELEARRAVRRTSHVDASSDPERLHDVRKTGRRLRYAAEAVTDEPVALFGDAARELGRAGEDLHDVLGDHRDEVLFAEHVRRAAAHAAHEGRPTDAFERLAAAADRRAADRLAGFDSAVRALRRAEREWSSR